MNYLFAAFLYFWSMVCIGFGGAFNHTGQVFHIWAQRVAQKLDDKYIRDTQQRRPGAKIVEEVPVSDGWSN